MLLPYVTKFPSVLIFADEKIKYFEWIYFRGRSKKLCLARINFLWKVQKCAKSRNVIHAKFSAVRYVPWPQWIEKLDIIDKVGVQHLILDQIKACGEI